MELRNARLEAGVAYADLAKSMFTFIKMSVTAYEMLGRLVDGHDGDRILAAMYGAADQGWYRSFSAPNPVQEVNLAKSRASSLALVAIQGEFETAARGLLTDMLEFWPESEPATGVGAEPPGPRAHPLAKRGWAASVSEGLRGFSASEGFIERCHGLASVPVSDNTRGLLALYDYCRRARNRVVHQGSIAGSDFSSFSRSRELRNSQLFLNRLIRRSTARLPEFDPGDTVSLEPKHLFILNVVVERLHRELEASVRARLDEDGYVRMAAHYSLGAREHPFRSAGHKQVYVPIRRYLGARYRLGDLGASSEFPALCRRLGLWDTMLERFKAIYE